MAQIVFLVQGSFKRKKSKCETVIYVHLIENHLIYTGLKGITQWESWESSFLSKYFLLEEMKEERKESSFCLNFTTEAS